MYCRGIVVTCIFNTCILYIYGIVGLYCFGIMVTCIFNTCVLLYGIVGGWGGVLVRNHGNVHIQYLYVIMWNSGNVLSRNDGNALQNRKKCIVMCLAYSRHVHYCMKFLECIMIE